MRRARAHAPQGLLPQGLLPQGLLQLLLASALVLALPAVALAGPNVGERIIERCGKGESLAGFSQQAYQQALSEMSATTEEYSPCPELIRKAQAAAAAGRTPGATRAALEQSLAAAPLTAGAKELSALQKARHAAPPAVVVGDQVIHPGVIHASIASALNTLPAPLLAVVALLVACAAAIAGRLLQRRFRERRGR